MPNVQRRTLIKAVAGTTLSCQVMNSIAQQKESDKEKLPIRSINLPREAKTVAIFFDFTCKFCADYHPTLIKWISTVPKTVRIFQYPIVNVADELSLAEQVASAKCFYAAEKLSNPDQLQVFVTSVYEERRKFISTIGQKNAQGFSPNLTSPLSKPSTWINAAKAARLNQSSFHRLVTAKETLDKTTLSASKLIDYRIIESPSIGIGGKYVLTPDSANGNKEVFYNLLNGLTSEIV